MPTLGRPAVPARIAHENAPEPMPGSAAGSRGKENRALAGSDGLTSVGSLRLVAGGIETRAPLRFSLSSAGLDVRDALARIAQANPDGIDRPERRAAPDADSPTD